MVANKMAPSATAVSSFLLFITALIKGTLAVTVTTPKRVFIPLGGSGEIPCQMDVSSYMAIYWNRMEGESVGEVMVSNFLGTLTGEGLDSGDFNISDDNALQIKFMQLKYEATYQCHVLDNSNLDDSSKTELIAIVKPETSPTITWTCGEDCRSAQRPGSILNLTCTSDEAKPAVTLRWTNDHGTPLNPVSTEVKKGTTVKGTFVTTSTIQYDAKRNDTLTCQAESDVIGRRLPDQRTTVQLYDKVTPTTAPSVTTTCVNRCRTGIDVGAVLNLTCTSGEARPPIKLKWTNSHSTPIKVISYDVQVGDTIGTFVTTATIQYTFKSNTTLNCQGEGLKGQRTIVNLNDKGIGTSAHKDNLNGGSIDEGGFDIVTILLVAVAVAVGVVIILGIAVAVLYKKNKEYPVFQSPMFYLTNGRATVSSQEVASPTTGRNLKITLEVTLTKPTSYDEVSSDGSCSTMA